MRKLGYFFYLVLIACGFGACKTQSLMVRVPDPAAIELPATLRKVLVFNRFVPGTGEYDRVKWGAWDSVDSLLWRASDSCATAFSQYLNHTERFVTQMPSGERMFKHNGDFLPEPLPWEGLQKIAARNYGEGLAILEAFGIKEMEPEWTDGQGAYEVRKTLVVTHGWRFYQPDMRRTLVQQVFSTPMVFTAHGNSREEALAGLPDKQQRYAAASRAAGEDFARQVNPSYLEVKRTFYSKGPQVIEEGYQFIEAGDWGKAYNKWKYHAYNGETDEIKAMCSYNMAILTEKDGSINMALGYARRAQKLMPSNLHLKLINDMTIRLFDIEERYESGKIVRNW